MHQKKQICKYETLLFANSKCFLFKLAKGKYNSSSILPDSEEIHGGGHGKAFLSDIKEVKASGAPQ